MGDAGECWSWVVLGSCMCRTDAAVIALAHHLCVCGCVLGDACVYVANLAWSQFDRIWV